MGVHFWEELLFTIDQVFLRPLGTQALITLILFGDGHSKKTILLVDVKDVASAIRGNFARACEMHSEMFVAFSCGFSEVRLRASQDEFEGERRELRHRLFKPVSVRRVCLI